MQPAYELTTPTGPFDPTLRISCPAAQGTCKVINLYPQPLSPQAGKGAIRLRKSLPACGEGFRVGLINSEERLCAYPVLLLAFIDAPAPIGYTPPYVF